MASIVRISLEIPSGDPWPEIVRRSRTWIEGLGLAPRDTIVLVPFAQHLPLARRAWARAGGWMPRIETTLTLSRSLGPAQASDPLQISFDAALDRLVARRLLRPHGSAATWLRRDPRGFDHAVNAVVKTAHALARAAAAVAPDRREDHWRSARERLVASSGPGATERMLARVAFEWAAASAVPLTDALYELRPAAWIAVQAGGPDPLTLAVLSHDATTPGLLIDTDPPADDPLAHAAGHADVSVAVCADFESEAQRTAGHVLAHLAQRIAPVALIAQDRLLMRRVRALLSREQVPLLDETGWKLSTTRAAAAVAGLLRVADRRSGTDDWLDWLKACAPGWPGLTHGHSALQSLERIARREGWMVPAAVDAVALPDGAAALWQAAQDVVNTLAVGQRALSAWLLLLRGALEGCGAWTTLAADDAGRQLLAALHLHHGGSAVERAGAGDTMSLDDFARWVDGALEDASFVPPSPAAPAADAPVVITPLERAMLRPFAAVVFAGADERHLGATPAPHPLLSDALAAELGLPSAAMRRDAEALAFAQVLRLPRVTLLRRRDDGGEPLAASPLWERLALAEARGGGRALADAADPLQDVALAPQPVQRPLPSAPSLLPARLSASACEALRVCPYRFFALRVLSLREADELEDEVQKRDYGTWLHAVLHRFHATRSEPLPVPAEVARLHEITLQAQRDLRLDDASFLPFAATFARFAPRYVEWLHARDDDGAQWLDGERELAARPAPWGGVEMHGVIDRVDSVRGDDGPVIQLIDYKTGSAQALRAVVKQPLEDTQLAFYAALMAQQSEATGEIAAAYLALDEAEGIKVIEHRNVEASGRRLVEGVGRELARLRDGAAMPALGEGRACAYCEARGLCRRDHWAVPEEVE
ncbi:PD-(D/E)XK nuclease family protein [Piscinibacter sp.]|uniref:PD-(D/E)XK nuclease family protein n=1 Tax=Piscinibacter sp. TaxID=1903157 RepID=UPI002C23F473|nr:PD-(D/E)XK nuclease family protein [Albitalea sp.]HUG22065.1 PD-(D/E)XK nuclease family protein [Albitalea sp.]